MMRPTNSIPMEIIPDNFVHEDTLLSIARAFLISEGDERVAMARAMLELMNT